MGAGAVLAPYGGQAPLQAQEADEPGTEVGIRLSDLVDRITYTIVDRFEVKLTNLTASETYQLIVSSDSATTLGIDGCGAASQKRTVTGATSQNLYFIVYACAEGGGTVTAEVRRTGASTAEATVSQRLTVLPIPDYVPADQRPVRGASEAVARVGTPGIVMNLQHGRWATSFEVTWNKPADGGRALTGYGVLQWTGPNQPDWGEAESIGPEPRRKTYNGLALDTVYKFRIHACNEDPATRIAYCGWWTDIHEVRTGRRPDPPHTISFPVDYLTATSARVTWRSASDTGGVPLTGFQIQYWPRSSPSDVTTITASASAQSKTLRGLSPDTAYAAKLRTCNDNYNCTVGAWSADHWFTTGDAPVQPDPGITPDPTTPVIDLPDCGSVATRDHTAPTGLNVIPLSGHQIRLTWTGSTDSTGGYYVEFNPHGLSWPQIVPASNKKQMFQTDASTGQLRTCLDFSLDSMISRGIEDEDNDGLADNAAYDVRVRAHRGTEHAVSETITIIDTPITKADGYVPESPTNPTVGQADVTWTAITSVLSNHYANGRYILRPSTPRRPTCKCELATECIYGHQS